MPVKENQELTLEEIREYFKDKQIHEEVKSKNYLKKIEKEHNALIKREYYMSDDIIWMSTKSKWKGIKSIGLARNITERNNS